MCKVPHSERIQKRVRSPDWKRRGKDNLHPHRTAAGSIGTTPASPRSHKDITQSLVGEESVPLS